MECRRGLAMRILSVCLSVKRVHCDKTEERPVQIFIAYEKQDAQLSQRDRAAGCVIVFAKSRTLELGDNDLRTL